MRKRNMAKAGFAGLLALLLLLLPLMTACPAPPEAPPVEKPESIKVGRLTDLTGPYAAVAPPILAGLVDYFEFLNEKKGGIDGVPVELIWVDVKQDAALSVSAYKRLKAEGVLVMSTISSTQAFAIKSLIEEDKIPVVGQAASIALFVPPSDYFWTHGISSPGETLVTMEWFDQKWQEAGMDRPWKIGFIVMDIAYTKGGVPGQYKWCDDKGVEMVGTEITPPPTLDYSTNITRLVDAGADVIYVAVCGAASGLILKQMGELGVLAPIDEAITTPGKIVPLLNDCAFTPANLKGGGEWAAYAYGDNPFALWWEMDKYPGVKVHNDFMFEKYGKLWTVEEGIYAHEGGWNNGMVIAAAIERAVKAVGWENLNHEAVIEKGLKGLRITENLVTGELSYADYEGDRLAIEKLRVASWDVAKGLVVPVTDWIDTSVYQPYTTKYTPMTPHPGMYVAE